MDNNGPNEIVYLLRVLLLNYLLRNQKRYSPDSILK